MVNALCNRKSFSGNFGQYSARIQEVDLVLRRPISMIRQGSHHILCSVYLNTNLALMSWCGAWEAPYTILIPSVCPRRLDWCRLAQNILKPLISDTNAQSCHSKYTMHAKIYDGKRHTWLGPCALRQLLRNVKCVGFKAGPQFLSLFALARTFGISWRNGERLFLNSTLSST